jgi:hypothetical protein
VVGVAITQSEVGSAGGAGRSDGVRSSALGPAVFEVSPQRLRQVLDWAEDQAVPRSTRRTVHAPSVDAWAVLDGGIVHVYGYGLTSLPAGMYVIGMHAARLIVTELGFVMPDSPDASTAIGADELRRRHRAAAIDDASGIEQADLLATCTDAVLMRWVATTLRAEYGTAGAATA